jgi:hypothetical protein
MVDSSENIYEIKVKFKITFLIFKGPLDPWIYRLSRNVGKKFPLVAA